MPTARSPLPWCAAIGFGLLAGCRSARTAQPPSTDAGEQRAPSAPALPPGTSLREIRFAWRPSSGPAAAYAMDDPADQHRIVFLPGVHPGKAWSVVIGMHGQPQRGKPPRDYEFAPIVLKEAASLVERAEVPPFVLALPVFRFEGRDWPGLDLGELRGKIEQILAGEGVSADGWYVFGHSGAAGCGGDGLNGPLVLSPKGVGFIDTCVGTGFVRAVRDLHREKIPTMIVHSVETAGFPVRQKTEYSSSFDFGRVYAPLGLSPRDCPSDGPAQRLRDQPYRCAATADGTVRAFVVDTGEGLAAHIEALRVGTRYFLRTMLHGD
jgi:hypothetical protein